MMNRRIKLLGTLAIEEDGRPSRLMDSTRGVALVAYLIFNSQPQSREQVADLLWEATSTRQSLMRLRELLVRVRQWLPEVQATRQTVAFEPAEASFVDLLALRGGLASGDAGRLDEALQLYEGDFLASFYLEGGRYFNEWLVMARERLRVQVLAAHRRLCQLYGQAGAWEPGAAVARRWVTLEPIDEEAHRWLMQMLARSGRHAAALQAYDACRRILAEELGVEPEAATEALARQLAAWREGGAAALLPALTPLDSLTSGELPEPGLLPANAILPYQRNQDFIGRQTELLQIAALLGEVAVDGRCRVVAVTGIAGLGKTQTAVEFCYRYGRYFPGGVFWLSFAEAESVAEEVAAVGSERGLGLFRETEQLTLADRIGRVRRAWQEPIPRLLVFDNCETEALLAEWLPVTGGCRVLLTSRRGRWSQALGVEIVPIAPLSPDESSRLLERLAPRLGGAEALAIALEIGHLPLALHLAGGFLQRYGQISAADYVQQLRRRALLRHPSLQGRGAGYSPTGHELNVERTFALSWEQLDPAAEVDRMARRLLTSAAALSPGEPIPAAWLKAALCPEDDDLMTALLLEDGLSRLLTAGFLQMEEGQRVVLHRLLAFFVQEVSGAGEMARARESVAGHMVRTLSALRQREGHLSTLPFAPAHLRHVGEAAVSDRSPLAGAITTFLGFHLEDIGDVAEAGRLLERGTAAAAEIGDVVGQAQTLSALSSTLESMGRYEASLESARQAVALFGRAETPHPAGLAEALYYQGWAHYRLGQAEEALGAAEAGYAVSQAADLQRIMAYCLNLIGVVHYYVLGAYDVAQEKLEESLALYCKLGNRRGESVVLNNMGESARLQGDFSLAVGYYERALAIARKLGNHSKANIFLSNLCGARIRLGQYARAAADLEALIARNRDDWFGLSEAYRFLAEAYLGQGKAEQALAMAQQALEQAYESDPFEQGRAWRVLGAVAARLGRPVPPREAAEALLDAAGCYERSLSAFRGRTLERDRAITLWYWGRYEQAQGNRERGEAMWREAREIFVRQKLPLWLARIEEA